MAKVKIAYLTDPHCPDFCPKALNWAHDQIKAFKPDYTVVGGDVFEADAASRFENEKDYDLLEEYQSGAAWLDTVFEAAPKSQHYWTLGNHDFNIVAPGRINKGVRRLCDWNNSKFYESFARWNQVPFDFSPAGALRIGQVLLWHGHDGAEEHNALRLINAHGGYAHLCVVGGHTHIPHGPTRIMRAKHIPLPFWYMNAGTMGPRRPEWTRRQDTSRWQPAIALIEAMTGPAMQAAKNWGAEVRTM